MTSDLALLTDYAQNGVQGSFAAVVKRHIDLVYSTALRQVRSPQLAEEVAQSVFTDLARNADKLKADTVLTAWLYQVARRTAIDVVRRESRRQLREQVASEMNAMNATADDWTHVEPLLDDAMEALEETDRTAVLLRYFQNKSLREVGQQLGVSDDAAQKRVSRAVNRLRDFFVRREVKFGTSGFVALISANAVQAAPAALVSTVSAAAIAGTALTTTIAAQAAATTMNWISLKTICATVTTAIATGTGVYLVKEHQVENLRFKNQELISNQQTLTADRDAALAAANSGVDELERLQSERNELLRLRGEVTRLRSTQAELERLRDANASLQASLESSSTPVNPIADPLERQKQVTRVKLTDGMHRAAQLVSFATDYEGWYPTNWLGTDRYTNDFAVSELNSFEMVYEHPFHRDELGTNWGRTIVVREVYAWPTYDGQWGKVYGFIDGHAQTVILPDGNFAAWEAENTFNPDWLPQ